jgi:hypothetical protein
MSADVDELTRRPEPPRLSAMLAALLELSMLAVMAYHRSVVGLALALAYAWFSATWSIVVHR